MNFARQLHRCSHKIKSKTRAEYPVTDEEAEFEIDVLQSISCGASSGSCS
jgi:hypothetical protein